MKGGKILRGRVFLHLRCEKDVFLLNDLVATYERKSSWFMLRSVRSPEMTQMCFKFSSLLIYASFSGSWGNGIYITASSAWFSQAE